MSSMDNLDEALATLDPQIQGRFIFASSPEIPGGVQPFATIREPEGTTLVIPESDAVAAGFDTSELFTLITPGAQTSLHSVGITATITSTIASRGIPCNVIAGVYHDHFFVPSSRAEEALALMESLSTQAEGWLSEDGEWA